MFFNDCLPSEKAELAEQQVQAVLLQKESEGVVAPTNGDLTENVINIHLSFEIKEVRNLQMM